jgi:hypothetical protein
MPLSAHIAHQNSAVFPFLQNPARFCCHQFHLFQKVFVLAMRQVFADGFAILDDVCVGRVRAELSSSDTIH